MDSLKEEQVQPQRTPGLEPYLRDQGLEDPKRLQELCERIRRYAGNDPVGEIEEADRLMIDWFRALFEDPGSDPLTVLSRGRLALFLTDDGRGTPLLQEEAFPSERLESMRRIYRQPEEDFRKVHMRARGLDLGAITQVADSTLSHLARRPKLRFTVIFLTVAAAFALLFHLTR